MLRGIRGATTAENTVESIRDATVTLLREIVARNQLATHDLAAAMFCLTPDLDAAFPAKAARDMGWQDVPLLDYVSPAVSGSLSGCIRVLLLWNTQKPAEEIRHVYQEEAVTLRPDLLEVKN